MHHPVLFSHGRKSIPNNTLGWPKGKCEAPRNKPAHGGVRKGVRIIAKAVLLGAALLIPISVWVHPYGDVKGQHPRQPLLAGAQVSPEAQAIVRRACRNCHSEESEWPWYSYVAPLSWMVEHDVHEAREHMNLSRWGSYSAQQQAELLTRLGTEVRSRQMPLPKYLQLHPEARLSGGDIEALYRWARAERKRVR